MSEFGELEVSFTAKGLPRYSLKVSHKGLKKLQVIKGDDRFIVSQKARLLGTHWDEIWHKKELEDEKRLTVQKRVKEIEEMKKTALERTNKALAALDALESTLRHTLTVNDAIDWDSLKNHSDYPSPKPKKPDLPPKPVMRGINPEPDPLDIKYSPTLTLVDKIIPGRRQKREDEAHARFMADLEVWKQTKQTAEESYQFQLQNYERNCSQQNKQYEQLLARWNKNREDYINERNETNRAIDEKKKRYLEGNSEAVIEYCDLVLSNSQYPDYFPQTFEIDYNADNKLLIVDYQLPPIDDIRTVKEVKFVQSRLDFEEKHITQSQLNKLYDSLIYQITLRTIHELFEADKINAIDSVIFNGYIRSIDRGTGQEITACILSIQAGRDEFLAINLANIDPKVCFKKLKGVGSSQLHSLTPIAPILKIEREDVRFVSSYEVVDKLQEGDNLAAMDWEDFEHLIRELFEKEFSKTDGEVKVTRASRDGGVDAVVFDPDPIRGGKIVIQAKRYTGTVGVSAVRDLYGTVMNEGAIKGILVSTSDYGPDAYAFAKDKPLTLLNGSNLLHLLQNHGYSARIDLREAKVALSGK
jgi:restriction system protein